MHIRELAISDAFEITPIQHTDDRGAFLEWLKLPTLEEVLGHPFNILQANTSISKRGTLRGIHFADFPIGQAKYVTCSRGSVIDFIIDIRIGSPTFGKWDSVLLDTEARKAVYLSEGLGHAFLALDDHSTVSYLVSDIYRPGSEHAINPLDPQIGLSFPLPQDQLLISEKDLAAPDLATAASEGLLPNFADAKAYYQSL